MAIIDEITRLGPRERDPRYFRTWQRVSLALQRVMREWIPERHFRELRRFEDRDVAYQVLVYAAARLFYSRSKTEFTYDVAEPNVPQSAMYNIGIPLRLALEPAEVRLRKAGLKELSRRYSRAWREDILRMVEQRPRTLIALLAAEAKLIDSIIDLGTSGDLPRFIRTSNAAMRRVLRQDMRDLIRPALEEARKVLTEQAKSGFDQTLDTGVFEHQNLFGARRPECRVGGQENGDRRDSDSGRQMRDSGVIADVERGGGEPAGKVVEVVVPDSVLDSIIRSCDPPDGNRKAESDVAKSIERPVLSKAS